MRKINLNFVIGVLLLGGMILLKSRHVGEAPARVPAAVTPSLSKAISVPSAVASLPVKAPPVAAITKKIEFKPEPFAAELAAYSLLKKKVF